MCHMKEKGTVKKTTKQKSLYKYKFGEPKVTHTHTYIRRLNKLEHLHGLTSSVFGHRPLPSGFKPCLWLRNI